MVSDDILQAAIIARMRIYGPLTALTTDLRELGYQGTDFTYPNVRLGLQSQVADDECPTLSVLIFSIYAYSDKPSSKECSALLDVARRSISLKRLTDVVTPERFIGLRMMTASMLAPVRVSSKVWRADAHFTVKISET